MRAQPAAPGPFYAYPHPFRAPRSTRPCHPGTAHEERGLHNACPSHPPGTAHEVGSTCPICAAPIALIASTALIALTAPRLLDPVSAPPPPPPATSPPLPSPDLQWLPKPTHQPPQIGMQYEVFPDLQKVPKPPSACKGKHFSSSRQSCTDKESKVNFLKELFIVRVAEDLFGDHLVLFQNACAHDTMEASSNFVLHKDCAQECRVKVC